MGRWRWQGRGVERAVQSLDQGCTISANQALQHSLEGLHRVGSWAHNLLKKLAKPGGCQVGRLWLELG